MLDFVWKRLVRFGFRLLYNEMAWGYDAVSWAVSLGQWRSWQRSALAFVTGPRVLELGHGPGHMLAELCETDHQVVGLDLSPSMGKLARKRAPAPLIRGMAQELPFPSGSFDTVLSTFPTEYITSPKTLGAVNRVLKSGGRFIIVPEAHLTGSGPAQRVIEWLFRITGQRQGPFAVNEAGQWPDHDKWRPFQELFNEAGFRTRVERSRLPGSLATILIARKAQR